MPNQNFSVVLIGLTGSGKSSLGNAILNLNGEDKFPEGDGADSVTSRASLKHGKWDDREFVVVDTPGLNDVNGLDATYVQQITSFLETELRSGINAILIVINGQDNRFTESLKKLIMVYQNMHNKSKEFWNHLGLVFTRCYANNDSFNKTQRKISFQQKLYAIFNETFRNSSSSLPAIPSFFVDSKDTRNRDNVEELRSIFEWVTSHNNLSTQGLIIPDLLFDETRTIYRTRTEANITFQNGTETRKIGSHTEIWPSQNLFSGFRKKVKVDDYADVPIMKTKEIVVNETAVEGKLYNGTWILKEDWHVVNRSEIICS